MAAPTFTVEKAQAAEIQLELESKGKQAVHDVVTALRANRRSGTACAKIRSEVAGSGKKPWRQKGTGRARSGQRTSPVWSGGGVVFGPRPRDYSKAVNKTTRKLALRSALGARIAAGDVVMVNSFAVADGKTKSFLTLLGQLSDAKKTLIVGQEFDEATYRAARNYGRALLVRASDVNVEQLLLYRQIILTQDSLPILARRTQK